VAITFDPAKRDKTLRERAVDFRDAEHVFAGLTLDYEDVREDYGETRIITIGFLAGRMVMVVWTSRGSDRHIISMRKCNAKEQKRYRDRFETA
jgi:uncharacterized DUF497 family protein